MPRRERNINRRAATRVQRQSILVVCGAEKTEVRYIQGLRDHVDSTSIDLAIVERPSAPDQVVAFARDYVGSKDFDERWCVVDVDMFQRPEWRKSRAKPVDWHVEVGGKDSGMKSVIRPYGDTTGDGMVQVSFTLPVPHDKKAEGAALQLAAKMGLEPAMLVHAKQIGDGFTFFVVYGSVRHLVEMDKVQVVERDFPLLGAKEINAAIRQGLRRKVSVVGACIGTDAHTVGIDAILNLKGIAGEKGLEYYREFKVLNMGAQVSVPELVAAAKAEKADAVLVSQVVTQKDAHLQNTREMSAAFREALPAGKRPVLIVGGPRFDELMAGELGVDRIFGRGTTPREVASYLVHRLTGGMR